jgi:hypothetical protein
MPSESPTTYRALTLGVSAGLPHARRDHKLVSKAHTPQRKRIWLGWSWPERLSLEVVA